MSEHWNKDGLWEEQEEDGSRTAGVLAGQNAADRALGQEKLGVTKTGYDRGRYDKQSAHEKFHDAQFGDKKTITGSNGESLHRGKDAAKRKYGEKAYTKHVAQADHIDPIKSVYDRHKGNPFLTDQDIKEVVNRQGNFQELSWHDNASKQDNGGLTVQRVQNDAMLAGRSVKNASRVAHNAGKEVGKEAGMMALATSGISNIVAVIKGEKDPDEALTDTAITGGKSAALGYLTGGGLETVTQILTNSSSKFLKSLSSANVPAKVVTTVVLIGGTMKDYFTGEITTGECITKLGETGFNVAVTGQAMLIGQALIPVPVVGAAVGALVGSFLAGQLCGKVGEELRRKDLEHQERLWLQEEYDRAAAQAEAFQRELEGYLENYFRDCRACFDEALSEISLAFQTGDAERAVRGANQVTRKLGGSVAFDNRREFAAYLSDGSIDVF